MFEKLLAYAFLLDAGIVPRSDYGEYLDSVFIETPDNEMLLELEWCVSDIQKSISIIRQQCYENSIDYDIFGRFLFSKLEEAYFLNGMDIEIFGEKSYAIWQHLPEEIHHSEPFWTLCYADDPLSWGDEKQTREIYEKAFRFYDSTKQKCLVNKC